MRVTSMLALAGAASATLDLSAAVNDARFIAELNSLPGSWTAGANGKFASMTLADAKKLMGVRLGPQRVAGAPRPASRARVA